MFVRKSPSLCRLGVFLRDCSQHQTRKRNMCGVTRTFMVAFMYLLCRNNVPGNSVYYCCCCYVAELCSAASSLYKCFFGCLPLPLYYKKVTHIHGVYLYPFIRAKTIHVSMAMIFRVLTCRRVTVQKDLKEKFEVHFRLFKRYVI